MICNSNQCAMSEKRYQIHNITDNTNFLQKCNFNDNNIDQISHLQMRLIKKNSQLSSKASLKSFTKDTLTHSTAQHTQFQSRIFSKQILNKSGKISISQLKKIHQNKNMSKIKINNQMQQSFIDQQQNSIIDKLENCRIEEKSKLDLNIMFRNFNITEIPLPKPRSQNQQKNKMIKKRINSILLE